MGSRQSPRGVHPNHLGGFQSSDYLLELSAFLVRHQTDAIRPAATAARQSPQSNTLDPP